MKVCLTPTFIIEPFLVWIIVSLHEIHMKKLLHSLTTLKILIPQQTSLLYLPRNHSYTQY